MSDHELSERIRADWQAASAGWQHWEAHIQTFLAPVTQHLLHAADVRSGQRVWDVGCGFGEPALSIARSVGPDGYVLATDPVAEMIAAAKFRAAALQATNVTFRVGTEAQVTPADGPFDAVIGRFSFIFSVDGVSALQVARERLKPGGRIALSAWTPVQNNPSFQLIQAALLRHAGIPAPDPSKPGVLRWSPPGELAGALAAAGFREIETMPVRLYQFARDIDEFWRMTREMSATFRRAFDGLTDSQRNAVHADVSTGLRQFESGGVLRIPGMAQIAWGRA